MGTGGGGGERAEQRRDWEPRPLRCRDEAAVTDEAGTLGFRENHHELVTPGKKYLLTQVHSERARLLACAVCLRVHGTCGPEGWPEGP